MRPLIDIGIVLAAGLVIGLLFRRYKQSVIPAYLIAGIIIGPYAAKLIRSPQEMGSLGELGIILLMFVLGTGFPSRRFKSLGGRPILTAILQMILTTAAGFTICKMIGLNLQTSFIIGSAVMFSSTAIVVKVLNDRAMIESIFGGLTVTTLILQDLVAVVLMTMLPFMLPSSGPVHILTLTFPILKAAGFITLSLLLNIRIIPMIQVRIAALRSRELFLLSTLVFCLGMSLASMALGLSPALGAFVAGLIVSESEFNTWILAGIMPFRDAFLCVFFVSMGMMFDPAVLIHKPLLTLLILAGLILGKTLFAGISALIARYDLRTSVLTGFSLGQASEFSFIILLAAKNMGLLDAGVYSLLLVASLLSMLAASFITSSAPELISLLPGKNLTGHIKTATTRDIQVVICGYGPVGMTIGRALQEKNVPFTSIELNARTVQKMSSLGIECIYGDASSPDVLEAAGIRSAHLAVVTTPDRLSSEHIVRNIKLMHQDCRVIVRTRFDRESDQLYKLGADKVIQEESEAGFAMLESTLLTLGLPAEAVKTEVETVRVEREGIIRDKYLEYQGFSRSITAERIILHLGTTRKEEAISKLVDAAATSNRVKDSNEFLLNVLEREEMSNTGVGNGISIPHARTSSVEDVVAAIGLSHKGIEWDSPDGRPVKLVVLFGVNENSHDLYLKTLASAIRIFNDPGFIQQVLKCENAEVLLKMIRDREALMKPTETTA
jgi:monovalent cation:H+ antiporter-2, CPA2 family